jgi:hypothetical protein
VLALVVPGAAQAASTGSVTMVSQAGDFLGAGQQYLFDSATGSVSLEGSLTWAHVSVSGGNDLSGYGFQFEFAPPSGGQLQAGEYVEARRFPFEPANLPGISIDGDGRGCDQNYGRFLIKDIHTEAGGQLDRLWLLYETRCDVPDHPALFGEIRIGEPEGASATSTEPAAIAWPQTSVGEEGSSVPVTVVAGPSGAQISKVAIAGADAADFKLRGDDCNGATLVAAARCQVEVGFDPEQSGDREAQLEIESSDKSIATVALMFRATPAVSSVSPLLGPPEGATSVTIHGSQFTGASAVMFGSTPATSFSIDSDTEITATSPAGSIGPEDVTVIGPRGTSLANAEDVFTYATAPAAPTDVAARIEGRQASVSFMTADAHGSTITHYTAVATPGDETASGTSSPITVAGLSEGTTYTFTVTATNAIGTGPASEPSAPLEVPEVGEISGRVTNAVTKAPIEGVEPCAATAPATPVPGACALTNANGEYTIPSLPPGEYLITFVVHDPNLDYQYYNHKYDYSEAEPVAVVANQMTTGIDAELGEVGGSSAGELAGKVTDASSKAPIAGIEVCAYEYEPSETSLAEGLVEDCARTGPAGEYAISGLPPGEYIVEFTDAPESDLNYVTQYYRAKAAASEATPLSLPALTTIYNIDAELDAGGRLAGEVRNASTGAAVGEILVCAHLTQGEAGGCAVTDSTGEYTITGLAAGRYVVEFISAPGGYLTQYYDDSYLASEAQPVTVAVNATTADIDAAILPGTFKAPVALAAPTVSGTAGVGGTLSCSSGSWSANPPPNFAYAWLLDGTPIPSANESAYTVQGADVGHSLSCEVQASNEVASRKGVGRAISPPVAIANGSPVAVGTNGAAKQAATPSAVVLLDTSKMHVSSRHTIRVPLRCERARCQGSVELLAQVAGRVLLARGSFALAAGHSAIVTLRFTRAGVERFAHANTNRLKTRLVVFVRGGQTRTSTVVLT